MRGSSAENHLRDMRIFWCWKSRDSFFLGLFLPMGRPSADPLWQAPARILLLHGEERTADLSLFGCRVDALKAWPKGTRVRIRIAHRDAKFVALGKVVYVD